MKLAGVDESYWLGGRKHLGPTKSPHGASQGPSLHSKLRAFVDCWLLPIQNSLTTVSNVPDQTVGGVSSVAEPRQGQPVSPSQPTVDMRHATCNMPPAA